MLIDDEDIGKSEVEITIDVDSIDTNIAQRDQHLRRGDFLAASKHPSMQFFSKAVRRQGEDKLVMVGELTIRENTKVVVLHVNGPSPEFTDPGGRPHLAFPAETELNRFDYGLQ